MSPAPCKEAARPDNATSTGRCANRRQRRAAVCEQADRQASGIFRDGLTLSPETPNTQMIALRLYTTVSRSDL